MFFVFRVSYFFSLWVIIRMLLVVYNVVSKCWIVFIDFLLYVRNFVKFVICEVDIIFILKEEMKYGLF